MAMFCRIRCAVRALKNSDVVSLGLHSGHSATTPPVLEAEGVGDTTRKMHGKFGGKMKKSPHSIKDETVFIREQAIYWK